MSREAIEARDRLKATVLRLEAENASLREQLEEADKMHTAYCCVLDHATGGRMSKAYLDWRTVCRVIDERVTEQIDAAIKERDELRALIHAVVHEIPHSHRKIGSGNAPGHGHSRPGIWDSDNGKLAGKPCAWCRIWAKAERLYAMDTEATE